MRALVGRTLRWFLDAAPPKPARLALADDAAASVRAELRALDGKTRAEVNADLRAMGTPLNPERRRAP